MSRTGIQRSGVLRAGSVVTMYPAPPADAVFWEEGRIRAVGPARRIDQEAPAWVPRYDLPNTLVTPGLVDGHTHFAHWAINRRRVQLSGARTLEDALRLVAAAAPDRGWVVGLGWDANGWSRSPDRHFLDEVQPLPVYLDSLDLHAAWLNSAALAEAGITAETSDPPGGRIVRDAGGRPTGLLLERAVDLVRPVLPAPSAVTLDQAVTEAQSEAHKVGITGIHDVESMPVLQAFERLEQAGALRLRVLFHPPVAALPELVEQGRRSGQGSAWLSIGGVKMFLDGSLGSRTAWMLRPYTGSRDRGMPITDEQQARDAMITAAEAGLATTVHAIGDAAVRRALDLIGPLPRVALPHRIEHFQCVHPDDLRRVAQDGLILSMQPSHLLTDIPLVERHWGSRGSGAYAFRSLLRAGARLVFGSDVPVASLDPRDGIFAALSRRQLHGSPGEEWYPEERLGFLEVLRAYTVEPALAGGAGHRRGCLAPGFDADLVAWSVDPGRVEDPEAFRHSQALLTVVGGEVVMQV